MQLDKVIQSRCSIRKFKDKKPNWRDIIEAIDAARYAPMSGNNYSVKFILVDVPEKILKISEACQQNFLCKAHYLVVVCSNPSRTVNCYGERGKIYCRQQAGAAIQNFLLKLEEKGLASCWTGHFVEDQIKRVLKIPEKIQVEAVFPIGYAFEKKKSKAKIDLDNILYFEEYGNSKMKKPKKLEV